jgi:hypothetical protein
MSNIYVYRLIYTEEFTYKIHHVKYTAHLDKSDNCIKWVENCMENDVHSINVNITSFKPFLDNDAYLLFVHKNKPYVIHYA